MLPDGEGEVGILAVGRCKEFIKASDFFPKGSANEDCRTGDIVYFLHIIVFRLIRVLQSSVVPAGGIGPDNSARFLQPPVRVDELGTHHTGIRASFYKLQKGREPAFCHFRIIV